MDSTSIKYLLKQQRIEFKESWESQLNFWAGNWTDVVRKRLSEMTNEKELMDYLKGPKRPSWDDEFIYYNLKNQTPEDRSEMFDDILEMASYDSEEELPTMD